MELQYRDLREISKAWQESLWVWVCGEGRERKMRAET